MTPYTYVTEIAPAPPGAPAPVQGAPVFVDPTGRRERWVRAAAWTVGGLVVSYLALLVVSLVGPPGVLKLALPGVGPIFPDATAPRISTGTAHARPADVFRSRPSSAPVRTAGAGASAASPATTSPVAPGTTSAPARHASVTSAPRPPVSAPAAAPSTAAAPTARPTPAVRPSATGKPTALPTPAKTRGARRP